MNLQILLVNRAKKKKPADDNKCDWTYWSSPEALALFQPMPGETVEQCLVRTESLLH